MLEQAVHLVHGELHGEELVEEAEGGGWAAAVAGHPRLDVVDLVVDLVDDLVVRLDLVELLEVVRGDDVHGQHLLHEHLDGPPGRLYLHFGNLSLGSEAKIRRVGEGKPRRRRRRNRNRIGDLAGREREGWRKRELVAGWG